jgi:hypothetical protein
MTDKGLQKLEMMRRMANQARVMRDAYTALADDNDDDKSKSRQRKLAHTYENVRHAIQVGIMSEDLIEAYDRLFKLKSRETSSVARTIYHEVKREVYDIINGKA